MKCSQQYLESKGDGRLATVSNIIFSSKTDDLSKIAIYKLYLEVEIRFTKYDYQRE